MTISLGKSLPKWGGKPRSITKPVKRGAQVRLKPKGINYTRIKEEVEKTISELSAPKRNQIPSGGTLPERMIALALVWLGIYFQAQISQAGGRLRVGGAIVDFVIYLGDRKVILRCQGDYYHSLPGRKQKDLVQWSILHQKGFLVSDLWEGKIYQAWTEGNLRTLVSDAVQSAA